MPDSYDTFIVDSFTNEAFRGNPAGVQLVDGFDTQWMQSVASELNLSETAFIRQKSAAEFEIRFFSPKMEIPLCGHATLAAAKIIFSRGNEEALSFVTANGVVIQAFRRGKSIEFELPAYDLNETNCPTIVSGGLGIEEYCYCGFNEETKILMLEIASPATLRALTPDYHLLLEAKLGIAGVCVTCQGNDTYDYHSRYFWPWSGTNEDPVTGGTQTFLAKYWARKLGRNKLRTFQASERTGRMEVQVIEGERVRICGEAVTVLNGKMWVAPRAACDAAAQLASDANLEFGNYQRL